MNDRVPSLLTAYAEAVAAKNVDVFMQLYDEDVRVFDAWGKWSYEGTAAWRVMVESWFSSMADDAMGVHFDEVKSLAEGNLITVSAIAVYTWRHGSEAEQAMHNRISWVIQDKSNDEDAGKRLKIVHEHTSLPVNYEDSKAIFQRS